MFSWAIKAINDIFDNKSVIIILVTFAIELCANHVLHKYSPNKLHFPPSSSWFD